MKPPMPAQLVEVRCRRALVFVFGAESPTSFVPATATLNLEPVPGNITFTITIIILSPGMERHPLRPLPSPSPLLLEVVLPVLRVLRLAAVPRPAPARLSRTGHRPATPGTSTI